MEFTFDLSQTPVIGRRQRPASGGGQNFAHYSPSLSSSAYAPSMSSSAYGSYSLASTATLTSAMAAASSTTNVSSGTSVLSSRDLKDLKDSILSRSLGGSGVASGSVRDVGEGAPTSTLSPRRSFSITAADASASMSGWKRPWMSQVDEFFVSAFDFYSNHKFRVHKTIFNDIEMRVPDYYLKNWFLAKVQSRCCFSF